jgi:hypothetical protein
VPLRCALVCAGLLLSGHVVYGGSYQRTKDGKTLVWNNYPLPGDEATWSGQRDAEGYASGRGTLTWFSVAWRVRSDSNAPPPQRPIIISRYTGNMVRGKFDGPVVNIGASGKAVQLTFVNGSEVRERTNDSGKEEETEQEEQHESQQQHHQQQREQHEETAKAGAPSPLPQPDEAAKTQVAVELKEQTDAVFAQVANATGNFQDVEWLDSVQELPPPVSENIGALGSRTREIRAKVGRDSPALNEYQPEIVTAEALSLVKQVSRDIAMSDAAEANSKMADFLQSNPEAPGDNQQPLWRYLKSLQNLCDRLEKEAEIHLQRAQSLAAANKTSEAIREYQEAYRTFPNPATAGKIRQLQDNSLGL